MKVNKNKKIKTGQPDKIFPRFAVIPLGALCVCLFLSCLSLETQEKRLAPFRSASEIRMDDIRKLSTENPVKAIDVIGIYRKLYTPADDEAQTLLSLENDAVENLRNLQKKAVEEERWDDAASLSRSLSSLGVEVETSGLEPDFLLAGAKKKLEENNVLGAMKRFFFLNARLPLNNAVPPPFSFPPRNLRQTARTGAFPAICANMPKAATALRKWRGEA